MTKAEARKAVAERLRAVKAALNEAKRIADEAGIEFRLSVDGRHAGTYYGKTHEEREDYDQSGWHSAWDSSWC
jgi:hypothetical protein